MVKHRQNILFVFIFSIIIMNLIRNLFSTIDTEISYFCFIGEEGSSSSYNLGGSSTGGMPDPGKGPGEHLHVNRPESNNSKDDYDFSNQNRSLNTNIEIKTIQDAIDHLEKLREKEKTIRIAIARDFNISQEITLNDVDISFKKPYSPIAKFLIDYRNSNRLNQFLNKGSPGKTSIDKVINHLRKKL